MSRYGDGTPKEQLWEYIQLVQAEQRLGWAQVWMLLVSILADILHYEMGIEEV